MEKKDAAELVGELKGLMPMVSDQQMLQVRDALMGRDSVVDCMKSIRSYAASYEQFSLAGFLDHLPARPCEVVDTWNDADYKRVREEGRVIAMAHAADNDVCDRLQDEHYNEIARKVIEPMDTDIRNLLLGRKSLRSSQWIRSLVADYVRVHRIIPSAVMQEVA